MAILHVSVYSGQVEKVSMTVGCYTGDCRLAGHFHPIFFIFPSNLFSYSLALPSVSHSGSTLQYPISVLFLSETEAEWCNSGSRLQSIFCTTEQTTTSTVVAVSHTHWASASGLVLN
ncbi:uncharacterized protein YALI1_E27846g [Yarrowia lipolytica]|uniref:Uncharacterized protein n=1 Tax=Yarrowia lipolytica TaxID=4952 RepID=A0A1D8NJP4_YARLL|nr:hypothetical protein YALI1_E27846g [Yarrowia lipolytica]